MSVLEIPLLSIQEVPEIRSSRKNLPLKVLFFGDGNFLRGFAAEMIEGLNRSERFQGEMIAFTNRAREEESALNLQNGFYTVLERGFQKGKLLVHRHIISSFRGVIDPFSKREAAMAVIKTPELRFLISNTTEAGIEWVEEGWRLDGVPRSFPARLTWILYHRFLSRLRGVIILPCELIEMNGDRLKEMVLRHLHRWNLGSAFEQWIVSENHFCNTLVDRIVPGFPKEEAPVFFQEWGYQDSSLVMTEPYHFWAIEGDESLSHEIPFGEIGKNVIWVKDLTSWRLRKVSILNGLHTLMALNGILSGRTTVREMVDDREWSIYLREILEKEILPSLPGEPDENARYGNEIWDRFKNPFLIHRLESIGLNSLSKWRARILPTIRRFQKKEGVLPLKLTESLALLIRFYQIDHKENDPSIRKIGDSIYPLKENSESLAFFERMGKPPLQKEEMLMWVKKILSEEKIWGENLAEDQMLLEETCLKIRSIMEKELESAEKGVTR